MKKGLKGLLALCLLLALAYAAASVLGVGCPIRTVTGVPCPGCGLSRALAAVLRLDFAAAFAQNPMIFVLPPVFLYVLFGKKPLLGSKTRERALLYGVLALWLAVWLARLISRDAALWA